MADEMRTAHWLLAKLELERGGGSEGQMIFVLLLTSQGGVLSHLLPFVPPKSELWSKSK